jgi:hypothetical protein
MVIPTTVPADALLHVAARRAYDDAYTSDGVTSSTWRGIAVDLRIAADEAREMGLLGFARSCDDHADDADGKAIRCERMVHVARSYGRIIDTTAGLVAVSS